MEALLIYIAKSSGLVVLFYCAYYFLLRKETFFNSNRWFLLAGLITSLALPFLVYTKVIWVESTPMTDLTLPQLAINQSIEEEHFEINWNYIILFIYSIGFITFLIKFAMDFNSLHSILKGKKIQHQADYKFIDVNENIAPFSYFKYIVYNSSMYTTSELENIIEHEKVHSEQNHTIDVLVSRFFCLVFWFNPIIWFYKKAIVQNLEFIADKEAAKKISDKRAYQYTLLKITTHENCIAITNHFYQSLIKKRIVMLNKNQSKKRNSWKYCAIIPALVAFVLLFQVEIVAQEKGANAIEKINPDDIQSIDVFTIDKNTTDAEIDQRVKTWKEKFNISAFISELKRNSGNAITSINIALKDEKGINKVKKTITTTGIEKIGLIIITKKNGTVSFNFADDEPTLINEKKETIGIRIKNTQTSNINNDAKNNSAANSNISTNHNENNSVNKSENTIRITSKTDAKPIIVINGKLTSNDFDINSMDPNKISSINVLKGLEAHAKYGDIANNGVIEIFTKKKFGENEFEDLQKPKIVKGYESKQNDGLKVTDHANSKDVLATVTENKNIDFKKAVIIIDGKISDYKVLEKTDSSDIKMVKCADMNNYTEEQKNEAIKVYGEKAVNGFIEVQTSEYYEKHKNVRRGYPILK